MTQLCERRAKNKTPFSQADMQHMSQTQVITRMWANAQRDDRPAEHRWRPLFNAAKFG